MGSFGIARPGPESPAPAEARGGWTLGLLLAATFAIRAAHPGQPIVDNYVGRQVPTAMVARNLERGSGFLRPEMDTGPFPNLFLVEPPIYPAMVVAVRSIVRLDLDSTGRLVSAAAITLGAWGLFGLVRRREGRAVALLALGSFGLFPVMIRYGRAFQPDPLMIGAILAGLRGWDEYDATGDRRWAAFGGFVLSTGIALKVTSAWALLPFLLIVRRRPMSRRLGASAAMLAPALLWYLHAWQELAKPVMGSTASSDNAAIWLKAVGLGAWLDPFTWLGMGYRLIVHSFTPVGFVLAGWGLASRPRPDRVWIGWGVGSGLSMLFLAEKWHHAYYWMALAPLASFGMARALHSLWSLGWVGRTLAGALGSCFLALVALQTASTWRTPEDWQGVAEAGREVASIVPEGQTLIAPEALLYMADRRGYRLEFGRSAAKRAAGELGVPLPNPDGPLALVEAHLALIEESRTMPEGEFDCPPNVFHYRPAPRFVADSGPADDDSRQGAWRRAIRGDRRFKIRVDRPTLLIAELP